MENLVHSQSKLRVVKGQCTLWNKDADLGIPCYVLIV